jgi:shikimate kinase
MSPERRVLLVGMMGAGKTTTGRMLADRLGWPYVDTDDEIERRTGRSVPEIWKANGEAAFRSEESVVLADVCASQQSVVVSVGGGAILAKRNREEMKGSGLVVWLRADVATLLERVGSGAGRPLLSGDPSGALSRLWEERAPLYAGLANVTLDVDRMSPPQVVDRILDELTSSGAAEVTGRA